MTRLSIEARLARGVIANRFGIEGPPTEGVLAVLVPARDRLYERSVTLELPRPAIADNPVLLERFVEGARAAIAIEHAGVVRVRSVEYDADGSVFIVRERVKGSLLSERPTPMTLDATWQVLDPVIEALATAHTLGLVHGALRPAQIALHENARGAMRPKITGFGSAPLLAAVFGDTGPVAPRYAAPELFRGAPPTTASDVWAIAVIACELLSGDHPIAGAANASAADLPRLIAGSGPRPMLRLVPHLPTATAIALDRALAVAPEARFPHAGALQAALVDLTRALPSPIGAGAPGGGAERARVERERLDAERERERLDSERARERERDRDRGREASRRTEREPSRRTDRDEREPSRRTDRDEREPSRRAERDEREPSRRTERDEREPSRRAERDEREPSRGLRYSDSDAHERPRQRESGGNRLGLVALVCALALGGVAVWLAVRPDAPTIAPTGTLIVAGAEPGAVPRVDGAARALDARGALELEPGRHHIEVPGFVPLDVDVRSEETLRVELEREPVVVVEPPTPVAPVITVRSRCFGSWRGGFDCEGGYCDVRLNLTVTPTGADGCGTIEWSRDGGGSGRASLGGCDLGEHDATFEEPTEGVLRRVSMRCSESRTSVSAFDSEEGESRTASLRREGDAPPEATLDTPAGDVHPCHGSWSGFSSVTGANVRVDLDALGDARCGRIIDDGSFALSACSLDGSVLEARSELGAFSLECEADESGATLRSSAWGTVSLSPR